MTRPCVHEAPVHILVATPALACPHTLTQSIPVPAPSARHAFSCVVIPIALPTVIVHGPRTRTPWGSRPNLQAELGAPFPARSVCAQSLSCVPTL